MIIPIIAFIILLLTQIAISIYAWLVRRALNKDYSDILSGQIDPAGILEVYSRVYRKVNLRVNAEISTPALAFEEFVMLNREKMYLADLYTNYFVIYQLELSRKEHNFKRRTYIFQNLLFFFQLAAFVLGLGLANSIGDLLIYVALTVQVVVMVYSFIAFMLYEFVLQDVQEIAIDLLNLDEFEQARAEGLKNDLKFSVFEYPHDILSKIVRFFLP